MSLGSLVPRVRAQGLQTALDIYSSGFRGAMAEIGGNCPIAMGFCIVFPVQPFIRIKEYTAVTHDA